MLSVKIYRPDTGAEGYVTELDLSPLSTKFRVINIDGIDCVDSNILSDKVSLHYGALYRGWSVGDREITIDIVPIGDIQANRRELLSFFGARSVYRLELTDGVYTGTPPAGATSWINGYIRTIDYSSYSNPQGIKLIFVCPYPYFTRRSTLPDAPSQSLAAGLSTLLAGNYNLNAWPFFEMGVTYRQCDSYGAGSETPGQLTLINDVVLGGDIPTGLIFAIKLKYAGTITVGQLKTVSLQQGSIVIIDTRSGEKAVYTAKDGVVSRQTSIIQPGSKWTTLNPVDLQQLYINIPVPNSGVEYLISAMPEYAGM